MKKNVKIRISGVQKDISDEPTVVECIGTLHSDPELHYIRYIDNDGIHNLIKIRNGHAIVSRSGALSSVMEFIGGEQTKCVYPTPYGNFDTIIDTRSVELPGKETDDGTLFTGLIKYDLTMNGQTIKDCELNILVCSV